MWFQSFRSIVVLGLGIGIGGSSIHLLYGEPANAKPPQQVGKFNPYESLAPLVEQLSPAVVNIDVSIELPQMNNPFGWSGGSIPTSQGSGFLISEDGYLLTNYHVIEGADKLVVKLSNKQEYTGTVVGYDDSIDIALVKIESAKPFPYSALGSSKGVREGDWSLAIGYPFGLSHTVTSGIISAKERVIGSGPYDDFLQTDASINPGNSGGPLFNLKGEVIGIHSAINPRAQGIGFSVPIDKVSSILQDLKTNGRPSRGWLGVGLVQESERLDDSLGAQIGEVYPNTPAAESGLQEGDIVIKVGDQPIDNIDSFIRLVGSYRAGESTNMTILRKGKVQILLVTLGKRPTEKSLAQGQFTVPTTEWGVVLGEISGFDPKVADKGLVILRMTTEPKLNSQLKVGDVIISVNGVPASSKKIFHQEMTSKDNYTLRVWRQGNVITIKE